MLDTRTRFQRLRLVVSISLERGAKSDGVQHWLRRPQHQLQVASRVRKTLPEQSFR